MWIVLLPLLASITFTGLLRRYALAARLLDIPNARSSHSVPTPRGGGVAIVIVFLLGIITSSLFELLAISTLWAFLGAGAWIAVVGFIDDHQHIPARWRLLAHFIGAAWGLFWLGLPTLSLFGIDFTMLGYVLATFYLVWMLNLYNFMDGIDGLASIEAITVCLGGILLLALGLGVTNDYGLTLLLVLLLMAVAGFLVWNFPPAKIFMGDAGSGFLGITLGLFSIQAAHITLPFFCSWLILLGVFIVDATWTLIRRFLRGKKVYEAHRSHAYQFASRQYSSHKTVSLAVAAINIGWLLPIALWVGLGDLNGWLGLIIAYLPLWLLAIHFKAGLAE